MMRRTLLRTTAAAAICEIAGS